MTTTEPAPAGAAREPVRDYGMEMLVLIRDAIPEGEHRIPAIAERLVSRLRTEDPDLLDGFLKERAYYFIRTFMSEYAHTHRRTLPVSREQQRRSVFSASVQKFAEDGDAQALAEAVHTSPFRVFRIVDGQDLRKPTGKLNADDVAFIQGHYSSVRDSAANEVAFWGQIKRRLGNRLIEEMYDEEQFERMYKSVCHKQYGD